MGSILNDVKHTLGLLEEDTAFDQDIIMHINTVFTILTQLGVGPSTGFAITGATETWDEFVSDVRLNGVRSYVYLRVKMLFDPPVIGGLIASMDRQIAEMEWRLNAEVDF